MFFVFYDGTSQSMVPWQVTNIDWVSDGNGFIQYSTNDYRRFDTSSRVFADNINAVNTWEMECMKISGSESSGYGMMFNVSDNNNINYYVIVITINGDYCILKRVGSVNRVMKNWARSERLNTGYNVINTLKAVRNRRDITIFINDNQVFQFRETGGRLDGNRIGYIVSIGDENMESFPSIPVDVRFRQKN